MSLLNNHLNSIHDAVTDLLDIDIAAIKAAVIVSGGQEAARPNGARAPLNHLLAIDMRPIVTLTN